MTARITAIMPTADRRPYIAAAIAQFLAQDRTDAELLILDDGADPVGDLVPDHPRIRYVREEERRTIGDKRNRLCELAAGEIIVHWDDDDWHAPERLTRQLAALEATGADICGLAEIPFLADDGSGAWTYRWGGRYRWVYGASLAYRRGYWRRRPFAPLRQGEDTRFLLDARDAHVHVMPEEGWLIARVHTGNTSRKQLSGSYWQPREPADLLALAGSWTGSAPANAAQPLNNAYAVLVHERPECVIDLVHNLRWHDDHSPILLYDGSPGIDLLDLRLPWSRWGVEIVPNPRPMKRGTLHGFALDCIAHMAAREHDVLTIVDSDQLLLRKGYPLFLARQLADKPFGLLSSDPRPQRSDTRIPPAQAAQAERALWQPLLDRFANGADSFVRWSFWPTTVIGAEAGREIAKLFADPLVTDIMVRSRLWATEEVLFPTFAALLGHPVLQNPCAGHWTQYSRNWSQRDLAQARATSAAFWMHPVPRAPDHPLRQDVRRHGDHYRLASPAPVPAARDEPILACMRSIPGWLEDDEARAILETARQVCARAGEGGHLVEIGSHCGKATVLLGHAASEHGGQVTAIDRFDGVCGSRDERLHHEKPTRVRFNATIAEAGLGSVVSARTGEAGAMHFDEPDVLSISSKPIPNLESRPERANCMITVAEEATLALPEFKAFNQGLALPRMRCWEMPFALFNAQLTNTMAVLDCTINPVTFQQRLALLYPHVLYRHWNPIQTGTFHLAAGIPDRSFDRVICINTLEHLLKPQREALMSAMVRKLKPGGRLIVTCDYYFDSFWSDPAFLSSGLIRTDREEVFNGFNKVTAGELMALGEANGLVPLCDEERREPVETDPALYRQQLPFPHACVAAIFRNGAEAPPPPGKKIVLALLSWNTRDVTIDSLRAYLEEAAMLRRLDQRPLICVCDNGSTDGTAAALQKCETDIDFPHRMILNPANLGNSVGRNQIIDFAREMDADYILFMDGDIEVVPFSSFAMLRYMENSGSELGCIGACSAGQTPHRPSASPSFYSVGQVETTDLVAWTQYGMFRREIFDDGVRFDEAGPFTGPGWGFEDNDLAFQMKMKGYVNQRFFGMTYLHRNVRSSIRVMRENGIDPRMLYQRRKSYVIDKWCGVPQVNAGPLQYVRTVEIRL